MRELDPLASGKPVCDVRKRQSLAPFFRRPSLPAQLLTIADSLSTIQHIHLGSGALETDCLDHVARNIAHHYMYNFIPSKDPFVTNRYSIDLHDGPDS